MRDPSGSTPKRKKKDAPKPPAAKRRPGRPTKYTEALAADICDRIIMGQSLHSIAQAVGIHVMRVYDWMEKHPAFREQYARAREQQADLMDHQIVAVAQRALKRDGDPDKLDPQAARVAIDAFKWRAAKLKPKVYGDKVDVTSGGESIVRRRPDTSHLTPEQRAVLLTIARAPKREGGR